MKRSCGLVWGWCLLAALIMQPGHSFAQALYSLEDLNKGGGLNFETVDYFLNKNFYFTRVYPPRISSQAQLAGIEQELKAVISALESGLAKDPGNVELLWRLGFAYTMAYNLDWADSKAMLESYFKRLFEKDPENKYGHVYYGAYLAQDGDKADAQKSLYHLEKAYSYGFNAALTLMGIAWIRLEDDTKALAYFKKLKEKYPNDQQLIKVIEGLEMREKYGVHAVAADKNNKRPERAVNVSP